MRLYGCGDNSFGQLDPSASQLFFASPRLLAEGISRIAYVTQSQCILERKDGERMLCGLPLSHNIDLHSVDAFLGTDEIRAYIDTQRQVCLLDGTVVQTGCSAAGLTDQDFVPDPHVYEENWKPGTKEIFWKPSLSTTDCLTLRDPTSSARKHYICAGASHSLLVCNEPQSVIVMGNDNRFGQLAELSGSSTRSTYNPVTFFSRDMRICAEPGQVAVGDLHCAVIDDNVSALYVWGSDSRGQTGGFADGEGPVLVELPREADATAVACGAHYTAVVAGGLAFVTGANDYGQLGLGDTAARQTFTQCVLFDSGTVKDVRCGRYTTYWLVE